MFALFVSATIVVVVFSPVVNAQYYENSTRYNELTVEREQLLFAEVGRLPVVASKYYPDSLLLFRDEFIDVDVYTTSPIFGAPQDYILNMIFDPCRNYEAGCCFDRYGTSEYIKMENTSFQRTEMENTELQALGESRVGDPLLSIDPVCLGLESPLTVIDLCSGCLRAEIDQANEQRPSLYPLSECPPSTAFHCLDPTIYTGHQKLLQTFQELNVEIPQTTPENVLMNDACPKSVGCKKSGTLGTDFITNVVKGGKVDYFLMCRERYMTYAIKPHMTWAPDFIFSHPSPALLITDVKVETSIQLKQYGGLFFEEKGTTITDWNPDPEYAEVMKVAVPNWGNNNGFLSSKLQGYYARVDNRTTSLNITVSFLTGFVTIELDNGLRELPQIQVFNGVEAVDRINFAISPGENTLKVNWCQNLIIGEKLCDKSNTAHWYQYRFQVIKPFYTCRRVVEYRRDCAAKRVSKVQPYERAKCWDYNTSLVADNDCYWGNGTRRPFCVTMAFSSTNYVAQCTGFRNHGEFSNDNHCGTFIEIHLPNITRGLLTGLYSEVQIEDVLIDVKVPPGLASGFRTIPLPTQLNNNPRRILCRGSYQVWWVLRTPSEFIIEKRKTVFFESPICDWDPYNKRYRPYATIARVDDYGAVGPNPPVVGSDAVPVPPSIRSGTWWEEGFSTEEIAVNKGFVFEGVDATIIPPQRL